MRLAVLIFFHFWGWNVLNLFLFPRLNFAMPQRRMSDWVQSKHTISFLSFFFFQAAHISSHWEVFYKKAVLWQNQSKNNCKGVRFVIKVARFKFATLLKLNSFIGTFHRFWTQMQLYTSQISYFEEHIFKYFRQNVFSGCFSISLQYY